MLIVCLPHVLFQSAVSWALSRCETDKQVEQLALYIQTRALAMGAVPRAALYALYFLNDFFHHRSVALSDLKHTHH
jgi:hypothetical protein